MHTPRPLAAACLAAAALAPLAIARQSVEANLAELYDATTLDPHDVTTRLRLAGYLQSLGLAEEGAAVLRELAAMGADINVLDDPVGCEGCRGESVGADIIVGDINGITNWGKVEVSPGQWWFSFSTGATACNLGSVPVEYLTSSNPDCNRHPVVTGNFYRVHNNQLCQIGQGWLKHRFFALSQQLCEAGCQGTNGFALGVNCSDPYTSGRAGTQNNVGPKYQVRPSSGYFPYPPPPSPPVESLLSRRIQVRLSDLNPANWPGAIYLVDMMYVQWQDAQAENDENNHSWRRMNIVYNDGGTPADPSDDAISGFPPLSGSTRRMQTPIDAWRFYVPTVEAVDVPVPNDCNVQIDGTLGATYWSGRFQIGHDVVDNNDGTWTYRYAIFNQNSDRAARSFTVPVLSTVAVTDMGFADVDYHSGDGVGGVTQDGTDWTIERDAHAVTWSTQTFADNPNANALRWATTYNFWFTADAPPEIVNATLGLFRPGPDADPIVALRGPECLLAWDLDGDRYIGFADLNLILSDFGGAYSFEDLNALLGVFGQNCN